jgi:hypothetical protein
MPTCHTACASAGATNVEKWAISLAIAGAAFSMFLLLVLTMKALHLHHILRYARFAGTLYYLASIMTASGLSCVCRNRGGGGRRGRSPSPVRRDRSPRRRSPSYEPQPRRSPSYEPRDRRSWSLDTCHRLSVSASRRVTNTS